MAKQPSRARVDKSVPARKGPLSEAEKVAIFRDRMRGASFPQISKTYNISMITARSVIETFLEKADEQPQKVDFKEEMQTKAVVAVNDGLDCPVDPYKRANVGVQVLRGLQVFAPDGTSVQINNLVASVPEKWRDRYISNED